MNFSPHERVDVVAIYRASSGEFLPTKVRWKNQEYRIIKLGYYHKVRVGNILHHIFSVATENVALRLNFDSETLGWTLEEIADGSNS